MIDIVIHAESSSEDCVSVDPTLAPIMEPDFGSLALDFEHGTSTVDSSAVHVTGLLDFWAPWQPQANPACSAIEPVSWTWIEGYVAGEWSSSSAERKFDASEYFHDERQAQLDFEHAAALSLLPTSLSAPVHQEEGWHELDILESFTPPSVDEHDGSSHSVSSNVDEAADGDLDRLLGEFTDWETDDSHSTVVSPPQEQLQREACSQEPGSAEQEGQRSAYADPRGVAAGEVQLEEKRGEGPAAWGSSRDSSLARGVRNDRPADVGEIDRPVLVDTDVNGHMSQARRRKRNRPLIAKTYSKGAVRAANARDWTSRRRSAAGTRGMVGVVLFTETKGEKILGERLEAEWGVFKRDWTRFRGLVLRESDATVASWANEITSLIDNETEAVASRTFPRLQEAWSHLHQRVRDGGFPEEIRTAAGEVRSSFEAMEAWASILGLTICR